MSYGLLGIKSQLEGEAKQGLGDLAGQQREAKRFEDQADQAEQAQKTSAIGMGAGTGMMVGGPMGALIGAGVGLLASSLF